MDEKFIRNRISELRIEKGVSEYRMSTDLGHSKSYIQSITSGRSLPSMSEFLYMCEYFGVSPKSFFDTETPLLAGKLSDKIRNMSEQDLLLLLKLADRLLEK